MAIAIECPQCGKTLRVNEELVGRGGKCPKCQAKFAVPRAAAGPRAMEQAKTLTTADLNFTGRIELPKVGVPRKIGAAAVLAVLLLMPLFYAAVILGLAYAMFWLAVSSIGRSLEPVVFWLIEIIAAAVLFCLIKPLVEPKRRGIASYPVNLADEPLLVRLLSQLSDHLAAPTPQRVNVNCDPRVVLGRGGELTIGLPLLACLSVEELAGLLAYQLALVRGGTASAVTGLIRGINSWLWQSVYGRGRLDQWLSIVGQRQHFHAAKLLLPLKLARFPTQAVLFVPMFIANTIGAGVIRLAERDADRIAARLIGAKAYAALLEREELIDFTWEGVVAELEFLHREQQLPQKLPEHLALRMQDMTPELRAVLGETVNQPEDRPFNSRASRPERLEWLAGEPASGVLECPAPAKSLLSSYDELAKQMSRDFYARRFGSQYLRTALQTTR
jgi:hypothetical protein